MSDWRGFTVYAHVNWWHTQPTLAVWWVFRFVYIKSNRFTLGFPGAPDEHQESIRCTVVTDSHIVVEEGQSAQSTVTVGDSCEVVS